MKRMIYRTLIGLMIASMAWLPVKGQLANTLYFMPGVPQANRINPAIQPECNFYLGFPMLAPVRIDVASSSLSFGDVISYDSGIDSLITFLHPRGDKEAFLNLLKPVNFISTGLQSSLASFGFRVGANFFSVDVTTRAEGSVSYPADLFNLLINGAVEGNTYTFDGLGADVSLFDEVSVGWSRQILDNLDIGVRAKALFGIGNLSTVNSELSLTTSQAYWTLQSDMQLRASLPFAEVVYNEDGNIEDIIPSEDFENPSVDMIPRYVFNAQNFGLAADLGVIFRPIENLQISASVSDLGYISWKDSIHEISFKVDRFDFDGIEVNPLGFSDDFSFGDLLDSTLSEIGDSLQGFLVTQPGTAYSYRLNTKLYAGVSYNVTPNINFGLLSRTEFLSNQVSQQFTASANFTTGRFLNLSLSYSFINSYYKNMGMGLSFNAGPFNMFLISDNALSAAFWSHEARAVNFWFGLNLVFGYKHFGETEHKDKPMVY